MIFLLLVGFFISLWLGGFFWCIFSSKFLLVSSFLIIVIVFFIVLFGVLLFWVCLIFYFLVTWLHLVSVFLTILRKGRNIKLNVFFSWVVPEGGNWGWGGDFGEFFVFLPNVLVIALMGRLFLGAGEDACRRGDFQSVMLWSLLEKDDGCCL